jgi:hypothetical protein
MKNNTRDRASLGMKSVVEEVKARISAGAPSPAGSSSDAGFVELKIPGAATRKRGAPEEDEVSLPGNQSGPMTEMPLKLQRASLMSRFAGRNNGRSGGWENYTVRLVATGTLSSSAGGVIAQSFLLDPTNLPLSEWSTFAGLFDEVRCTAFEVWFAPYLDSAATLTAPLYVGSFTRTTATPGSAASVAVAPDAVLATTSNQSKLGYRHAMVVPRDILYAATSSPAPGPYAGCPGSIQVYSSGNVVSTPLFQYMVVGRYALRGRL